MVPLVHIHKEIANYYRIDLDTMFLKSRLREIIEKRQLFHYLAKTLNPKMSLAFIGKYGLKMDHATVLNSKKTIQNLIDTEPSFKEEVEKIKAACLVYQIEEEDQIETKEFELMKYGLNEALIACKSLLEVEAILRRGLDNLNLIKVENGTT